MKFWYQSKKNLYCILLLPLSWVFAFLVRVRYLFYKWGLKKSFRANKPVIIVGNITVGGTGKTPFVIWLANYLKQEGYHPGIVSRGCGGEKHSRPHWVTAEDAPEKVGDEALLILQRTQCPLVLCTQRVAAVKELLTTACDIIIADDGLQHYALARDLEIVLIDSARQLGNRCFLPAGPLRESPKRLKRVDFVVSHGNDLNQATMTLEGSQCFSLLSNEMRALTLFKGQKIHAVAGIGHPERFFSYLRAQGLTIIPHIFPDHYLYQSDDFNFQDDLPILMTEKDQVKCLQFADQRFWYLPVETKIHPQLAEEILTSIKGLSDA